VYVLNRGEVVGRLVDAVPDMWYLEGRFVPADTPAGARFVAAASALDVQVTFHDHARAIQSILRESPEDEGTMFIVLSLSEGSLFGRRVFERPAVEWAAVHVPE
jgi:hypothetical protein